MAEAFTAKYISEGKGVESSKFEGEWKANED